MAASMTSSLVRVYLSIVVIFTPYAAIEAVLAAYVRVFDQPSEIDIVADMHVPYGSSPAVEQWGLFLTALQHGKNI